MPFNSKLQANGYPSLENPAMEELWLEPTHVLKEENIVVNVNSAKSAKCPLSRYIS